ncbi:MAG: ADP-heptose--LPS heptosyltransferase 2 [Chlamydiae bacterium]|nr:ADP-heptose--LPS heptosyltransferase 2 [Chlamydiota bacterium]
MKKEFRSIIVRMPNWIGDLVMATPILEDLRTAFPEAEITAMCQSNVAPLLERDPAIDELFRFSRAKGFLRRIGERNIVEKLKSGRYDLGILLTNSFSSAWRFWQGGVKNKIGFKGDFRSFLLDRALPFPENRRSEHLVTTYKRLLEPIGVPLSESAPRLILQEEEIKGAWEFVKRFDITKEQKIIGVNPGAAYGSAKCWPPERFREMAERLIKADPSYVILFFGDLSHKDLLDRICNGLSSRVVNLAGQTNLRELMALIKISSTFLTNDSGPMHIADSLETPLLALFGSTDPIVTGPYRQSEQVIKKDVACAPCFKRVCPIDFPCMKKISVDEVIVKLESYVKTHP